MNLITSSLCAAKPKGRPHACFRAYGSTSSLYPGHYPTSTFQKTLLSAGLYAKDMIATLGEATGRKALEAMRDKMLLDPEGRRILRDRPIINSTVLDLHRLAQLKAGTLGGEFARFFTRHHITPDSRAPVRFVDDEELAYVMLRYRQTHDFNHVLTGLSINVVQELALKWFEYFQTGLPMTLGGALFGPLAISSAKRQRLFNDYVPWAISCGSQSKFLLNFRFEEHLEMDLEDVRAELNITLPPRRPTVRHIHKQ